MTTLLEAALTYLKTGLSILPCRLPEKGPAHNLLPRKGKQATWEPFKAERATEDDARIWFSAPDAKLAIAVIGGHVSGNLEILDFDDREKFTPWLDLVKEQAPGLHRKFVAEESLRGGIHIFYRCTEAIQGNQKLARGMRKEKDRDVVKTLIETRGEGGYCVVAPTPGYTEKYRTLADVDVLTPDERDILLSCARSLDEIPAPVDGPPLYSGPRTAGTSDDGDRPGDEYNRDGDVEELLVRHGWSATHRRGDVQYWRRPGKDRGGISATFGHVPNHLHVFTSNASPLEPEKSYSPFALYAILDCGGNFAEASAQLRKSGFGYRDPLRDSRPSLPVTDEDIEGIAELDRTIPGKATQTTGTLAVAPDPLADCLQLPEPYPEPEYEPGMDDEDEEIEASPGTAQAEVVELPRPPDGFPSIPEKKVIEYALGGEQGLGRLAAELLKGRLCLDRAANVWYRWGGHAWIECRLGEELALLRHVQDLVLSTAIRNRPKGPPTRGKDGAEKAPAGTGRFEALMAAKDSLRKLVFSKHVLEYAASGQDQLGVSGDDWDQCAWYLPVQNGVVNLKTGAIEPGKPEDKLKTACPVRYDPDAEAPRFHQFIREIMPDQQTADFLRRLLGYGLVGTVVEHIFPVFWGEKGRNGKDTLFEAVSRVLGPLSTPISAKCLIAQKYQPEHDSAMLDLRGRRLVWASESGDRQPLDAAKVKLWTGGGTLKGRAPYGARQVEFKPSHKLMLISNYKPRVSADDQALWQRMVLVPFLESFVEKPQGPHQHPVDTSLPEKLKAESEGILAWLVRGCIEWQQMGLQPPDTVRFATKSYQTEEDSLGAFLEDCTVKDPDCRVLMKDLYERYVRWCDTSGEGKPVGSKSFAKGLKAKGMESVHGRIGYFYPGLKLVDSDGQGV